MQAIVQRAYGSADVLELSEVERPSIDDDEVLVRVVAAGVDRGAWHLMTGTPYLVRAITGLRRPKIRVPGSNFAGRVDAVGSGVTRFKLGDEVYGTARGAYAEDVCAGDDKLAPKPANITFEQAAVVPHPGYAALQAIRDHGKLQAGQTVLIIGASGVVGCFAVQIAKAFGAEVTGVCSTPNLDLVRGLGADNVIDYTRADVPDGTRHYDVVLGIGGNRSASRLRRGLTPRGTLVIVGGEAGGPVSGGLHRQLLAHALSLFVRQKLGTFVGKRAPR